MRKRFTNLFKAFYDSEKIGGLLLLICTVLSLTIANSEWGEFYNHLMHYHIDLSFANVDLNYSIEHWVNDGLMAIFFLMVGLEVERELYIGELSNFKNAILPVAAACGGMLVPSLIHFLFNNGTATQSGFAIPMATDIAFALGILALAGNRVPASVKIFLAALAIIDDIGAIIVIALFYTKTLYFAYLGAAAGVFVLLLVFNRLRISNLFLYFIPGIFMWYFLLKSGVHATFAGVLLAFAIPFQQDRADNVSYKVQHFLHKPVGYFIVPLFALVNTAIIIPDNVTSTLLSGNSLGIICGLFLGKVIGIFSFPLALVKARAARFPQDLNMRMLTGIGFLGGIGFTMSMLISNLAFQDADMIISSKLSVLVASTIAAITGYIVFMVGKPLLKQGE